MITQAFMRGAIVFAIAGLLTIVFRNRPAAVRHNIWAAAIIIQLALLIFVRVLPPIDLPVLPTLHVTVDDPRIQETTEPGNDGTAAATETPGPQTPSRPVATTPSQRLSPQQVLGGAWLLGMGLIFLRYFLGTLIMARIARTGTRVDDGTWLTFAQRTARELGITRPITLLWGDQLSVPITWGILYPMILLPESAHEWSLERRRFVLVHEMAHVRRFDAFTQFIAQLTLAVFWFSPFVWLAEWRLRVEREHACDDVVLHHGTEAALYADELLQMVRGLMSRKTARPAFAALAMARRSEFEGRMLAILDPHRRRAQASKGLFVALISLLIAAPVAALNPVAFNAVKQANKNERTKSRDHEITKQPASFALGATTCDLNVTTVHQALNVLVDNNNEKWQIDLKREEPGRCLISRIRGAIALNDDDTGVLDLGDNAFVELREVTGKVDMAARIEPSLDGPKTSFLVNGRATGDNGFGEQWIARVLPQVMSEAAYHTDARIRRLLAAHGLRGTLETIARINSTSSLAYHYLALIEARKWSDAERLQIKRTASRTLQNSTSDLDRVLRALGSIPQQKAGAQGTLDWLEKTLDSITSDGERRVALTTHVANADKEKLLMLARAAGGMSSGYELSSYLITASSYMLTKRDRDLENAWFALANKLSSTRERRQALTVAISYAYGNPRVQNLIAQSASTMSSDTDKMAILTLLASVR